MKIKVYMDRIEKGIYAEAIYEGKLITVLQGGTINKTFSDHIRGGKKAKSYRNNREYVDEKGYILKDCVFTSPSTAGQFVTGSSVNGYVAWKVSDGKSLGEYLKEKGLRA